MKTSLKIVIDHNSDIIEIIPGATEVFDIHSTMTKFIKVKDTTMIKNLLIEIFNRMGEGKDAFLDIDLEEINEDHRSTESW